MNIEIFDINSNSVEEPTIKYQDLTTFHRKLSHLLKTAKFNVLKVLKMKLNKMESKAKHKEAECKEQSKLKHKQEEIEFLNNADLDNLAKRIFANKYSEKDLERLGDKFSLEDRIVVRLFSVNSIASEINKFRSEHSDWEKLAEDLFYKNTGGRIKINKAKKVCPIPLANGVVETKTIIKSAEPEEPLFLIPAMETKKRKEETAKKKVEIAKRKEIENQNIIKKKLEEENKCLQISEEAICEFIKNEDDLDEWEKGMNSDEDGEIDLMTPLDGSEKVVPKRTKRGGKKVNGNYKREMGTSGNQIEAKRQKIWK